MNNRIFFLSPDNKKATGGVKQLYRQVDVLNKNGYEAYILHKKIGHKSNFFKNETNIKYNSKIFNDIVHVIKNKKDLKKIKKIKLNIKKGFKYIINLLKKNYEVSFLDSDILVFPEIYGTAISEVKRKLTKLIFNQNCYYSFDHFTINDDTKLVPYMNNNTLATIVASQDAVNYMEYSFPELKLFRIRLGINHLIFNYSNNKKKQIAFMPRKLEEDVVQLINILKCKNNLKDWQLVPIDNKSETEVAQILKESMIFLSFNHREGFGLPPAEAMACGCLVIGYAGNGGNEYFKPEFSYKIMDRNITAFAQKIDDVIRDFEKNSSLLINKGLEASKFILNEYSLINEEQDIIKIWKEIGKLIQKN